MKRKQFGLILAAALTLSACQGNSPATPQNIPSQEYVSESGWYTLTLPSEMEMEYMQLSADCAMSTITEDSGAGAFVLEAGKNTPIGGTVIEDLEGFQQWTASILAPAEFSWDTMEDKTVEGFAKGMEGSGTMTSEGVEAPLYGQFLESDYRYYAVLLIGNNDKDLDRMKSVLAMKETDTPPAADADLTDTEKFINAMGAVLNKVNGVNYFTMDTSMGEEYAEALADGVAQALEASWGITDAAGLYQTADELMAGMHNPEALSIREEYTGKTEMSREELTAQMEADALDEATKVFLLAAFDAKAAYGDNAILAWDLSRVHTIMSMGYGAGLCSYEEAMDTCLEAAKLAQSAFGSWDDFNQNYLYGYAYWAEEDLADPETSAGQRQALVEDLKSEGAFDVDWNTALEKTW